MPHYLSPLRMGSLARPGNHVEQVPSSQVLAARRVLFRHLLCQLEGHRYLRVTYQLRDYGNGRARCSNLVSIHQGSLPMHRIVLGILII
jgi:hypothetical protein